MRNRNGYDLDAISDKNPKERLVIALHTGIMIKSTLLRSDNSTDCDIVVKLFRKTKPMAAANTNVQENK
jgi:hypothetical protein